MDRTVPSSEDASKQHVGDGMVKRKKLLGFAYEAGSPADAAIQGGPVIAKGIGKLGALVRERAAKRSLPEELGRVVAAINEFRPTKKFKRELPYQMELSGWLKAKGGTIGVEQQRGRSRPDIVAANTIAIEAKGPTTNRELKTIADKVVRYQQHFGSSVCVLFDVLDEEHYKEWLQGMKQQFPNVVVIRKP